MLHLTIKRQKKQKQMKRTTYLLLIFIAFSFYTMGQNNAPIIKSLNEVENAKAGISNYWLEMGTNTYGYPLLIPVVVIQGTDKGPTLGLTAAIHGNELNGIPIIHKLVDSVNTNNLKGRIIAIPGLNAVSIQMDERRFIDDEDLNRNFPGKENGNRSEQYVYKIKERILPFFNIHIDMHTASFGRINTMYARVDVSNDTLEMLAALQKPDIILSSKGSPSVGAVTASSHTMRAESGLKGIPSITVEYGDPQVFQKELIERGYRGILNTLSWLKMYGDSNIENFKDVAIYCKKSYWLYMKEGGFLDVIVELNQKILKGDKIAIVKNAFGTIIREYFAPEDGIVIGKSTNPANMSGGRIIHLGIMN
jgi:predicted deacylase